MLMAAERPTERAFEVLSKRFEAGRVGDIVKLTVTDNQEQSLLESGAVKRAVDLNKEVKNHG